MAADEVLDTLEDAALHVQRLAPWLQRPAPGVAEPERGADGQRRRVVVLGTGWAAHALAKVIDPTSCDVSIVSPRNYFVFTPMLAAASVGSVEYRSILEHIRSANPTLHFLQGSCEDVDMERHTITVSPVPFEPGTSFTLPYDILVMAIGVRPSSLGVPGVEEHCLFLKDIDDATKIRKRVTECFERADLPVTPAAEQQRLLTFAVVGGGPTGCEFCGELSDFVQNDLRRFYPNLAPLVRILLLHRGSAILPSFGEALQNAAKETLGKQGIEVITNAKVTAVRAEALVMERNVKESREGNTMEVPCGTCIWAAGQGGQKLVKLLHGRLKHQAQLAAEAKGDTSRLFIDGFMRVIGADGSILALGDCARTAGPDLPLPQTAQVAAQQGAYLARLLNRGYNLSADGPPELPSEAQLSQLARARGRQRAEPFRFLDLGRLAYLGEEKAVAEVALGSTTVSQTAGVSAFLLWRSVYMVKQVSFRNRVLVLFDWVKSKIFGRDLTRF